MNKKYINHLILWPIISLCLVMCKKDEDPGLTKCQLKFIASWKVNDHFVDFDNDSLVSEYTANYNLQFISDGKGIISHPLVNPQSFSWECFSDTLSISNGMIGPLFVEDGKYVLVSETDSNLTLFKHLIFNGVSLKIETWRTMILTRN